MNSRVLWGVALASGSLILVAYRSSLWRGRRASVPAGRPRGSTNLLGIARVPAVSVGSSATVREAVEKMETESVGAVLVIDGDELKGIFTERDVMLRVALSNLDPETTSMGDVMTSYVTVVRNSTTPADALKIMVEGHIRHLPVVGASGKIDGVLSIRHLLSEHLGACRELAPSKQESTTYARSLSSLEARILRAIPGL